MITRRDFLSAALATAALTGGATNLAQAAARQTLTQDDLLRFEPLGQVTLLHFTDMHAQLMPLYFREPAVNIGVGEDAGLPPHLTGSTFLKSFGVAPGSADAYALSSVDFSALAKTYGKMGGVDRLTTLIRAIRAERPTQTLVLDGGDTWQGSYTSLQTRGADMVAIQNAIGIDAMTAHWEFTYGQARVKELAAQLQAAFLCGNVKDATWGDRVFKGTKMFERGGVQVAVIGQAFPYTPIANPRWMMPDWTFGIEEEWVRAEVAAARTAGADVVVLLSHNGFDVDRKLAARVPGIDVILTGHTHDAIPQTVIVGSTILTAPGSHGKFLGRLDLEVKGKRVTGHRFRLIPIFSDVVRPDPAMAALVCWRAPRPCSTAAAISTAPSMI
jgi:sulfur-oxidizing protein SoxB